MTKKDEALRAAVEALTLARRAIEPLTEAQIKLHLIPRNTPDKIESALSLLRSALEECDPVRYGKNQSVPPEAR